MNETKEPFKHTSWARNRAKFLVLATIQALSESGNRTDIGNIYFHSSVCISTLKHGLRKWLEWQYIERHPDGKQYRLTRKGQYFFQNMIRLLPDVVPVWVQELKIWHEHISGIEDRDAQTLVRILEPLHYHRTSPQKGIKKPKQQARQALSCPLCGGKLMRSIGFGDVPVIRCTKCKNVVEVG
jgi:predicted transcriptional regulator